MGATTFMVSKAAADAKTAFRELVSEAAWERGHGGYTGTIAEKHEGFVFIGRAASVQAAYGIAEKLINDQDPRIDDKWGPAGCIEVPCPGKQTTYVFFGWASS